MSTPFIRETVKWMMDANLDPVHFNWFDLSGAFDDRTHVNVEPLMTHRPPFDRNFVVWRGATRGHPSYEVMMMVAGTDPQDGIVVSMWKGPSGQMPMRIPPMFYFIEGDNIRYGAVDDGRPVEKDVAELMLAQVGAWYAALDTKAQAYVPSVKDTFTNRRKIASGKLPTYDWRTVVIEPSKPRSDSKGGTHASPRLHDRRGHLRRLQSGKSVWVKPCKVGDATRGIVWHDYAIRGQA